MTEAERELRASVAEEGRPMQLTRVLVIAMLEELDGMRGVLRDLAAVTRFDGDEPAVELGWMAVELLNRFGDRARDLLGSDG